MNLPKQYPTGVCAPLTLNTFEWSQRAQNCLGHAGIKTLRQLAMMDGPTLRAGRAIGIATLREFVRGCLSQLVVPKWVKEIAMNFSATATMDETKMVRIAGPYAEEERWMLEMAIAQLGSVPWCVLIEDGGYVLCRASAGYVAVGEEI